MVFARTPGGRRVRIDVIEHGTCNQSGRVSLGVDGPLLTHWIGVGSGHRTMDAALAAADERIEALGLVEMDDDPRDITIRLRVTGAERDELHDAATADGLTMSQHIRGRIF